MGVFFFVWGRERDKGEGKKIWFSLCKKKSGSSRCLSEFEHARSSAHTFSLFPELPPRGRPPFQILAVGTGEATPGGAAEATARKTSLAKEQASAPSLSPLVLNNLPLVNDCENERHGLCCFDARARDSGEAVSRGAWREVSFGSSCAAPLVFFTVTVADDAFELRRRGLVSPSTRRSSCSPPPFRHRRRALPPPLVASSRRFQEAEAQVRGGCFCRHDSRSRSKSDPFSSAPHSILRDGQEKARPQGPGQGGRRGSRGRVFVSLFAVVRSAARESRHCPPAVQRRAQGHGAPARGRVPGGRPHARESSAEAQQDVDGVDGGGF